MIEKLPGSEGNVVGFEVKGKLRHEDYEKLLIPEVDGLIEEHGKVRILTKVGKLEGVELRAAWDDFCFGIKHYSDIDRMALVADEDWAEWATTLAKPFVGGEVKFYRVAQMEEAWEWLKEG